jgi:hypothetical protein
MRRAGTSVRTRLPDRSWQAKFSPDLLGGDVFARPFQRQTLITAAFKPSPCPRRVNHQDLVTTVHPPGGEARFVAKGSHGHERAPGSTRRSEPR